MCGPLSWEGALKELWHYIRDHDLQDRNDGEAIQADGKHRLRVRCGKSEINNSDQATSSRIRTLRASRSNLALGMSGLVDIAPSGRHFKEFAAGVGHFQVKDVEYPRMQTRTIEEILGGKLFENPGGIGRRQSLQIDLGF